MDSVNIGLGSAAVIGGGVAVGGVGTSIVRGMQANWEINGKRALKVVDDTATSFLLASGDQQKLGDNLAAARMLRTVEFGELGDVSERGARLAQQGGRAAKFGIAGAAVALASVVALGVRMGNTDSE